MAGRWTGTGVLASLLAVHCAGAQPATPGGDPVVATVAAQLATMSPEDKAGQVLLSSILGRTVPRESSRRILDSTRAAGVVLFGHNVGEPAELARFVDVLQADGRRHAGGIPRLVAIDHEGGRVQRLRRGFTRLPSPRRLGRLDPENIEALGVAVGRQLRAVGVNMNLAPVVEASGADDNVVGDRAFGGTTSEAIRGATAFLRGLQRAGVAATAKHFPGNATSRIDPHDDMPQITQSPAMVRQQLLPPFAAAIDAGAAAIMLSHAEIPALDPHAPVTLSHAVVDGLLRGELGYRGVVLTDDLLMRSLRSRHRPAEAAVRALAAGADLLMVSDETVLPAIHGAIVDAVGSGRLGAARLDEAVGRVLALKARFRMDEAPAAETERLAELEAADRLARRLLGALERGEPRSHGGWASEAGDAK